MRSTKSSSDLQGIQSSSAMSGPTKGPSKSRPCLQRNSLPLYCSGYSHKTHGSNDALNALASSPSPSSHQLHPLSHLSNPSSQTQLPRATASPSSTPLSDPEDSDDSSLQFPSSAPLPSWGVMDPQDSDHSWHQHFAQARSYHHSGHSIHSSMPSSRQGHHDSDLPSGERDRGMYGSPISPLGSKWPASRQLPEAAFASPRCEPLPLPTHRLNCMRATCGV